MTSDRDESHTPSGQYPLSGVRVLDLTHVLAGPFCTLTLAQLGAEVIKIEQPPGGDTAREHGPVRAANGLEAHAEIMNLGRGKQSLAVDLKSDAGAALFLDLVEKSDVLVENFRPSVMKRLGLGYSRLRQRNPRLIYAAISGFGHDETLPSPYRDRPAFNQIAQAMSGLAYLNGEADRPPVISSAAIGDFVPGLYGALAVCSALIRRASTGIGSFVDVAMYDSLIPFNARAILLYSVANTVQERGGQQFSSPMGVFRASDGYAVITVRGQRMWEGFCQAIDSHELWNDEKLKVESNRGALFNSHILPVLERWASSRTKDEACATLLAHGVAAGPVNNTEDLFRDPHVWARRMLRDVGDMVGGTVQVPGNPIKFAGIDDVPERTADWVGGSTRAVLGQCLDYGPEKIETLLEQGVVYECDWKK